MKISKFFLSAVLSLVFPLAANAAVFELAASLTPGAEVPPVTNAPDASGTAAMMLDSGTGEFSWTITFDGLTGPATAARFYQLERGTTGGAVLNLHDIDLGNTEGLFSGTKMLSIDQVMAILSDRWYINIHTALNGTGEIRGQVLSGTFNPVPLPATVWLFLSGLAGLLLVKRTHTA